MKTALMEFIEYLERIRERDNIHSWVITTAKNYLTVEKHQIQNAYRVGVAEKRDFISSGQYYNETYGN